MKSIAGWLTLGTELDTSKFDKQFLQLENKLNNEEIDLKIINIDYESAKRQLENINKDLQKNLEKEEQIKNKLEEQKALRDQLIAQGGNKLKIFQIGENISELYNELSPVTDESIRLLDNWNQQNDTLTKIEEKYEKQKNKIEETRQEIQLLNNEVAKNQIEKITDGIGKGVKKITSSIRNWAVAFIGLRSAVSFVRSSVSVLSQHNEKLAKDLEYIRYALASALEPLITRIVELVYTLLQYLAYIIHAWTGKNIFENANKGLDKANKKAKDLQKTLQQASFDEMNILQDNRSQSESNVSPSVDLSKLEGNPPKWLQWIGDNGKWLLGILLGLVAGLKAFKLGLSGIKSLGIGIAVSGLVIMIKSIIDYLKEPTWDNFGDILIGYALLIGGVAIAFGAWPVALAAAVLLLLGIMAKFWDDIKAFFDNILKSLYSFGDDAMKYLEDKFGVIGTIIGGFVGVAVGWVTEAVRLIRDRLEGLFEGIRGILDGIIQVFKGDFAGGIERIVKSVANMVISVINVVIDGINAILSPFRAIVMVGARILGWDVSMEDIRIPNIPRFELGFGAIQTPATSGVTGGIGNNFWGGFSGSNSSISSNTDDESYKKIGQSIAENMKVNINNYMNSRQISKEVAKVMEDGKFAYNL